MTAATVFARWHARWHQALLLELRADEDPALGGFSMRFGEWVGTMDARRNRGCSAFCMVEGMSASNPGFESSITAPSRLVRLFLAGDVMIGRGVDQILPFTSNPELHEPSVADAREYVRLAERVNGAIPRAAEYEYVWGDALDELGRAAPDFRIVNLETSATRSDDWEPKGINYRMRPENVTCLTAAHIDCATLANNHVLDYGRDGLVETLAVLHGAGVKTAGAGINATDARAPAVLLAGSATRVLVVGIGSKSSGIPSAWAATEHAPGVNLWDGPVARTAAYVRDVLAGVRRSGDVVVASLHWGANFGFAIPERT